MRFKERQHLAMLVDKGELMNSGADQSRRLLVVLDPEFGDRLHDVEPNQPVWVIDSARNAATVKALWTKDVADRCLSDVTLFTPTGSSPKDEFASQLDMIDLHHGPYSSPTPYTSIEVIGAQLTAPGEDALRQLGFFTYTATALGFIATRSEAEAARLRRDLV